MTRREPAVRTAIWRDETLGAAELLRGAFADYAYDPHTHDLACFALITRGRIRIRTLGRELVAAAGEIFAIDADIVHAGWPVDGAGWRLRTLYVALDQLAGALGDDGAARRPVALAAPLLRDRVLAARLHGIHRCSEANGPVLKRETQYMAFAARLLARHAREAPVPPAAGSELPAVRRAKAFLDAHLDARVSLGDVAAAAGLPRFRLLRAFARAEGLSPHAWQRQARVRRAIELLRHGRSPGEVAAASGFADQAHLTRTFHRALGVTPARYRDAVAVPMR
jgi:AraC-like DNA-binding protein